MTVDLISGIGIYSVAEAAILLGAPQAKVRGWIDGWRGSNKPAVITNDLGWVDKQLALSFANLMELRFVTFFANAGVKLHEIRAIMDEVRDAMQRPHPFATNIVFKTDGVKVVADIAKRNGVNDIYDLRSKNYELETVIYKSLREGVVYDPKGMAQAWYPRKFLAPNVLIHPSVAFGQPALKGSGIPTEAIADTARAEGSVEMAAAIFEISAKRAHEAVNFEERYRRAA